VRPAALRILRELNIPKIQQLLIHWPTHLKKLDDATFWPKDAEGKHLYDTEADYKETWREMEKLVEEGLVETIGCVRAWRVCGGMVIERPTHLQPPSHYPFNSPPTLQTR
jgi:aryl-alcohol dehydrogenase-like predicted oxidoreductase